MIRGQTHRDERGAEATVKKVLDFFNQYTHAATHTGDEGVVITWHDTGWSERRASAEDRYRERTISIVYTWEGEVGPDSRANTQ